MMASSVRKACSPDLAFARAFKPTLGTALSRLTALTPPPASQTWSCFLKNSGRTGLLPGQCYVRGRGTSQPLRSACLALKGGL